MVKKTKLNMDALLDRQARFKKTLQEQFVKIRSKRNRTSNILLFIFAVFFIIVEGLLYAHSNGIISLPERSVKVWGTVIAISASFLVASILSRIGYFLLFKTFLDELEIEKRLFYGKFWSFIFYLAAIVFSLGLLGFTQENIVIFAGFLATGFAFAVREIIMSYLVWMNLLFKRPFRIGDIIKVEGNEGLVEHIGTFYVKLSDGSGDPERFVCLPTKLFLDKYIHNYGTAEFLETFSVQIPPTTINAQRIVEETKRIVEEECDDSGSKPRIIREGTMVNLETNADDEVVLVVIYPVVFERRRPVRTAILARVQGLIATKKK